MEYIPSFRDNLYADIKPSFIAHSFRDEHDAKMMYGLPKVKKFPMPDAKHVRSAIRFFNYAKPSQEQELANAILARMEDYGIDPDDINVGDDNHFKKYLQHSYLAHHGIKGMHWGVRRYQNPDGSLTDAGKQHYNTRLANKGDKLRAEGYDLSSGKFALTKKERIANSIAVGAGTVASIITGNPIPLMSAQTAILAQHARNRKAVLESIKRENDVKLKDLQSNNRKNQSYDILIGPQNSDSSYDVLIPAMQQHYGKNQKIDFMNIYDEMSKDKKFKNLLDSEDPDDYREAETAWLKKHGYL